VYVLALMLGVGVLIGGRAVEVSFDEWDFYRHHAWLVPAYWLGGMATHGLLVGAAAGAWLFAHFYRKPFLQVADALVIPGAFLMGVGRIGNFTLGTGQALNLIMSGVGVVLLVRSRLRRLGRLAP